LMHIWSPTRILTAPASSADILNDMGWDVEAFQVLQGAKPNIANEDRKWASRNQEPAPQSIRVFFSKNGSHLAIPASCSWEIFLILVSCCANSRLIACLSRTKSVHNHNLVLPDDLDQSKYQVPQISWPSHPMKLVIWREGRAWESQATFQPAASTRP
jgi:hypothetical protein